MRTQHTHTLTHILPNGRGPKVISTTYPKNCLLPTSTRARTHTHTLITLFLHSTNCPGAVANDFGANGLTTLQGNCESEAMGGGFDTVINTVSYTDTQLLEWFGQGFLGVSSRLSLFIR